MSLLQKGSKENCEVVGVQGVVRHRLVWGVRSQVCRPCFGRFLWTGVVFWGVSSMFWAVFVDGGGVLGCVVHILGGFCGRGWCFEAGFGAGFWGWVLGYVWRRGYSKE